MLLHKHTKAKKLLITTVVAQTEEFQRKQASRSGMALLLMAS
jgi:hypothetical protein